MVAQKQKAPQPQQPPLQLMVTDDLGFVRVIGSATVDKPEDAHLLSRWGEADRERSVTCMQVAAAPGNVDDPAASWMLVGRADGTAQLHSTWEAAAVASIANRGAGRMVGVAAVWSSSWAAGEGTQEAALHDSTMPRILTVQHSGAAAVYEVQNSGNDEASPISAARQVASWRVPDSAQCAAADATGSLLAVGAEGAELSVWDVATQQAVYRAKAGKPNRSGLLDKPWVTAVALLPSAGSSRAGSIGSTSSAGATAAGGGGEGVAAPAVHVVTGTAHHKLKLYDLRAGRRPQLAVEWGEARITALAPEPTGLRCWAANGTGHISAWDLRTNSVGDALKGAAGAIKALALQPVPPRGSATQAGSSSSGSGAPLLAAVGLDRWLRLYSTASRKQQVKVYLKQQLSGVAFCPPTLATQLVQQKEQEQRVQQEEAGRQRHKGKKSGSRQREEVAELEGSGWEGEDQEEQQPAEGEEQHERAGQSLKKHKGKSGKGGSRSGKRAKPDVA